MKPLFKFLIVFVIVAFPILVNAESWRGLAPLRSTREDVERLLGPAQRPPKDWFYAMHNGFSMYFLDNEVVQVEFAADETPDCEECLKTVPRGTILLITVIPKHAKTISDFGIDTTGFHQFNPSLSKDPAYRAYYNVKRGLIVSTHKGSVNATCYLPSAGERHLCRMYYQKPKRFVEVRVDDF